MAVVICNLVQLDLFSKLVSSGFRDLFLSRRPEVEHETGGMCFLLCQMDMQNEDTIFILSCLSGSTELRHNSNFSLDRGRCTSHGRHVANMRLLVDPSAQRA